MHEAVWQDRYYSFNSRWAPGAEMGSMRNGCGDDFFAHFSQSGCWLKGFAHEYPMSPHRWSPSRIWPGVLDSLPAQFEPCLREPAFALQDTTFCIWRRTWDPVWSVGGIEFPDAEDPDGSEFLLADLDGKPTTYQRFAEEYYERDLDLGSVEHVYAHRPLTQSIVETLNPDRTLDELAAEIREIGYPA